MELMVVLMLFAVAAGRQRREGSRDNPIYEYVYVCSMYVYVSMYMTYRYHLKGVLIPPCFLPPLVSWILGAGG